MFKKLMKNRFVLAGLAAVLAIILLFAVFASVSANNQTTSVVRIKPEITINKGQEITTEHIEIATVGSYNLPLNVAKTFDEVTGKFALTDMVSGDYILTSKLTDEISTANEKLLVLENGKYAYAVNFSSIESSLANKIIGGDIVRVVATKKTKEIVGTTSDTSEDGLYSTGNKILSQEDFHKPFIPDELQYVKVVSTTTQNGVDKKGANDVLEDNLSTVILEVNNQQLLKIKELENNNNNLTFAFVCRGDSVKNADELLAAQNTVLAELEKAEKAKADLEKQQTEKNKAVDTSKTTKKTGNKG